MSAALDSVRNRDRVESSKGTQATPRRVWQEPPWQGWGQAEGQRTLLARLPARPEGPAIRNVLKSALEPLGGFLPLPCPLGFLLPPFCPLEHRDGVRAGSLTCSGGEVALWR